MTIFAALASPLSASEPYNECATVTPKESCDPTPYDKEQIPAQDCQSAKKGLEPLPVQQGGRVKPLHVHARETLKYLTGKKNPLNSDPVVTYCRLSLYPHKQETLRVPLEHRQLKEFLEIPPEETSRPYPEILASFDEIRRQARTVQEGSGYRRALDKLLNRLHLYREVTNGENWTYYNSSGKWSPIKELRSQTGALFKESLQSVNNHYRQKEGGTVDLELTYAKMRLPVLSMVLCLLALASMVLVRSALTPLLLSGGVLLLQTTLIVLRVIISGRAPITNMYETVLFSGYGALIIALIIGHLKKERIFIYLGLAYNACTLLMLNFADGMLSEEINPLVPVLRDNFWLSTHVTMVILSYGALALSWVLANTVLFKRRFSTLTPKEERHYAHLTHSCLKYGVVLLAGGIILGGVWADYSWGRFWGWDPKETGSLIALCIYAAILHGRHTNWISDRRFMTCTAAAFLSIMMAWFGVNYILASGLHSYGFSEGGAIFLGSFFAAQILFLGITSDSLRKVTPF